MVPVVAFGKELYTCVQELVKMVLEEEVKERKSADLEKEVNIHS